jgi:signal transduction histidine kinase
VGFVEDGNGSDAELQDLPADERQPVLVTNVEELRVHDVGDGVHAARKSKSRSTRDGMRAAHRHPLIVPPLDYPPRVEKRIDELKRYVRFSDDDARRLASFREKATPHYARIAAEFYERIREHEDAHAVLTGEEQIARLQGSMVRWLDGLFGGVYDQEYFAQTERIGRVHVKVGLPQRYMLTAMALIRSSLSAIVDEPKARDALSRLLDIELAVMLESYREDLNARIARAAEVEHEALSRRAARTEHRYVNAVELADLLVIGVDAAGHILLFNREAERVTGWARDEVIGRPFSEMLVNDAGLTTRAGKLRDVKWQIANAPESRADDVVTFYIGRDVTEERAERDHRQQQERLAAVGTLAAGLAHEIRNPLNGAQLHVSFLERALAKGGDQESREAVKVVGEEIQRLAHLVTDFLDFARPRPLQRATTSAKALCDRAVQLVTAGAKSAKVELTSDLPSNDVVFEADPQRLEQVLLNLLQNAIEAAGPRGGHVVLRVRREPRHVWMEVEDDGPGLPAGDPPVFDAFYSTKPNGTGLGLAIVHRIVTDHGGTIDVDSRPGRTRFRVRIPL